VLAVVIAELTILEIDAGDDPIDGKFTMFGFDTNEQFCAWAPVAANSVTAAATPTNRPARRRRRRAVSTAIRDVTNDSCVRALNM